VKTLTLRLSEPLLTRLEATARTRGRTKSALVRDLLEESLSRDKAPSTVSCLDLAADLAGCLQGPGDLSFNKKHMRGYGR
jgi:hypothetical protein